MLKNRVPVFFFILALFGQSFLILGWKTRISEVSIFGVVFLVLTVIAFLRQSGFRLIAIALAGMFAGTFLGGLFGYLLGTASMQIMGVIGGALIGALGGVIFLAGMTPVDSIVHNFEDTLPRFAKIIVNIPFIIAGVLGGILGAVGLKDVLPAYFGVEGSGAFVGAALGLWAILFLGAPLVRHFNTSAE